ncbi:MAG: hypothetical protein IJA30_04390 [Bacilli bacterium]|nr:hypothetical protein [Bacilli bacterium]
MLESYKGKYVKVLVSSNSGAGIGGDGIPRTYNSMITVFGTIKNFDKQFLELENSTSLYHSGVECSYQSVAFASVEAQFNNIKQPQSFENKSSLININNIIEIAVIE